MDHKTQKSGVAGPKPGQPLSRLGRRPAAAARKAASQYRKTRSELLKLSQEPGQDVQEYALAAVAAYTQTFNKMRFIETEERDEISTALWGILDALPEGVFQKNALLEEFERLRNF